MGFFLTSFPLFFSLPSFFFLLDSSIKIIETVSYQVAQKCMSAVKRATKWHLFQERNNFWVWNITWFINLLDRDFQAPPPGVHPSGEWVSVHLCWTQCKTAFSLAGIFGLLLCDGIFKLYLRGNPLSGRDDGHYGKVLLSALGGGKWWETAAVWYCPAPLTAWRRWVGSSSPATQTEIQQTR